MDNFIFLDSEMDKPNTSMVAEFYYTSTVSTLMDTNNNTNASDVFSLNSNNFIYIISMSIILGILIIITIIGNIFVIAAILLERNLRTAGNYLVLSLAVADLMVACLVMPLGAITEISRKWTFGTFLCDIWTFADVLCCTASILHLLAIALDRYWAVTYVDYIHKRTPQRIGVMIFMVWTVAAIVSIAPLFGWKDADFNIRVEQKHRCLISQDIGYQIFATISTFYGPLIFILLLYWKIYQVARKRIRHKPGKAIKPAADSKQPKIIDLKNDCTYQKISQSVTTPNTTETIRKYENNNNNNNNNNSSCIKNGDGATVDISGNQLRCLNDRLKASLRSNCFHNNNKNSFVYNNNKNYEQDNGNNLVTNGNYHLATDNTVPNSCSSDLIKIDDDDRVDNAENNNINNNNGSFIVACDIENDIENSSGNDDPTVVSNGPRIIQNNNNESSSCLYNASSNCDPRLVQTGPGNEDNCQRVSVNSQTSTTTTNNLSSSSLSRPNTDSFSLSSSPPPPPPHQSIVPSPKIRSDQRSTSHHHHHNSSHLNQHQNCTNNSHNINHRVVSAGHYPNRHLDHPHNYYNDQSLSSSSQESNEVDSSQSPYTINVNVANSESISRNISNKSTSCPLPQSPSVPRTTSSLTGTATIGRCKTAATLSPQLTTETSPSIRSRQLSHNQSKKIKESIESKRERKAAKILAIITGIFVMCWLPFFVLALLMPLCEICDNEYAFSIFLWLGYLNSLLNPVIYTIFSPDFRNGFRRILCGRIR